MSKRLEGCLYLALAMVLVGSTVAASKIIAAGLPPFTATALRFAMALPLFLLIMRMTRTGWPALARTDWALLFVQAAAGSVGYTTLLISGLQHTSAADAGVIIGTLPVMSALIAIVLLGERPGRAVLGAIALATAGVLAIALQPRGDAAHPLLGNLMVMGAVVCEGLFILLNKRLRTPVPPLALSALMSAFGLLTALLPALSEAPWQVHASAQATHALMAVAYYAIVPTVGGFVLWYAGAARVSGAEASLFTALAPVAAVVFAATLLGEAVSARQVGGIACVLAGVLSLGLARAPRPVTSTTS
ncbi:EamA family transporter [Ralstonia pickettii]|uniref:EamA family transporter n=1 Tax=Ralstonia pickettii TaxID=329 RepID=A0A7X2HJS0_RALPI|nr:DMT family transporter [Ralstonia pickettii]MRS97808.1 EamA family transporter [Ralstonia pickettii]